MLPNEQVNEILLAAKRAISEILQKDIHIAISEDYKSYEFIVMDSITKIMADFFKVSVKDLRSSSRYSYIAFPRQICMYIAVEEYKLSTTKVARYFKRNHATVIHAIKTINNLMDVYPLIRRQVNDCIHLCRELITLK